MSLPANSTEEVRLKWSEDETTQLVEYLWEHRSEGGDGGNFKNPTINAAVQHLISLRAPGALGSPRNAKQVKTKWQGVSATDLALVIAHISIVAQNHLSSYHFVQRYHIRDPLG